jgi:hypothetical protein
MLRRFWAALVFLAVLAGTVVAVSAPSEARWLRGRSNITTYSNDEAVCSDITTLSSETSYEGTFWDDQFGVPTATSTYTDQISLYGSAADATAFPFVDPLVVVTIEAAYQGADPEFPDNYLFEGETTIDTPGGFDTLYARGIDEATEQSIAIPLVVDDPIYECVPPDPGPRITGNAVGVVEGDLGTTLVDVTFSLSEPSDEVITVDYTSAANPANSAVAAPGVDYVDANGTLTFQPGETEKQVTVTVLSDGQYEPGAIWGEWGFLELSNPTNAFVDPGPSLIEHTAIFVIIDDDEPVVVG